MNPEMEPAATTCGNCHMPMPVGLRFCRNCGFRLGEGSAEYTETVRFQNAPPGTFAANNAQGSVPYGYGAAPMVSSAGGKIGRRRSRMSGTTWMFIGLLIFFITAGGFTAIVKRIPRRMAPGGIATVMAPHSWAGVTGFKTTEGGVTFAKVSPPDGPADKAGLVGGDIITTVDGQAVHSDDEMTSLLRSLPIGKTVDIVYIRDGETKNTKLTTISEEETERLNDVFAARPEGRGQFGYDNSDTELVQIPNTKLFGVQLNDISTNNPADIAGIKEGDIVIQFGDAPIRTEEELLARVRRAVPYSTVKVVVMRNGERLEIPVKMGKG
jgi:predicted metalloprotease with PDZ domain